MQFVFKDGVKTETMKLALFQDFCLIPTMSQNYKS